MAVTIALARAWVQAIALTMDRHKDHLTELDSAIGDADHGGNMCRGFAAVTSLGEFGADTVGQIFVKVGSTLISKVGGAAGPLYGSMFRAMGKDLAEAEPTDDEFLGALRAGFAAVQKLGSASLGDKTMLDAYAPAVDAFEAELRGGGTVGAAAEKAAAAAGDGARSTIEMQAHKGRASYLGERSIGHQDPGATSTALIFEALAAVTSDPPGPAG